MVAQPICEYNQTINFSETVLQINLSHQTFHDFNSQLFRAELENHAKRHDTCFAAKRHNTCFASWLISFLNQDLIIQIHYSSNALPLSGLAPFIGCAYPL